LFYPTRTPTSSGPSANSHLAGRRTDKAKTSTSKPGEWQGGRRAIQRFFGFPNQVSTFSWPRQAEYPRSNATLKILIATIPDPIDSGLPHAYDRFLAAIEAAVQRQSYLLSDFELPWEDCLPKSKEDSTQAVADQLEIQLPGQAAITLSGHDE